MLGVEHARRVHQTVTPTTRQTVIVQGKPLLQAVSVTPMPTDRAAISGAPHRQVAHHAIQRKLLTSITEAVLGGLETILAVREEFHALVGLRWVTHVLNHLRPVME